MRRRSDVVAGATEQGGEAGEPRPEEIRRRIPAAADVTDLADIFSLLGDPGRLRLLLALRDGEVSVGELSAATGQSDSAVSHALQLLRAHRIVAVRRAGRRAYYRLDDPHVRLLLDVTLHHAEHSEMEHPEKTPEAAPAEVTS
ncbi:helix-turn-helix transcriptional regulator [Brachybacterium sp. FME24]|uniref:ArsR/SmtB family transcription factor n=1 Tax=Brachybacterium sp. FME24 TaxID=2742605 RepID=UPI00186715AF|nr:metalloregulator ArsR/SmtB family transcription factor [Brachybacterium sp. FME24]